MNNSTITTKAAKRAYWENHIRQWEASGETQKSYCQHHQLKFHQFLYWKKVFDAKNETRQSTGASGFVAVKLNEPASEAQALAIVLPNGRRLEGVHASNLNLVREIVTWQV